MLDHLRFQLFKRRSKFNKYNRTRTANGFDSKLEEAVYNILLMRERNGEIKDIRRQHTIVLQEGKRTTRIVWKCDFSFTDIKTGKTVFAEAKGFQDRVYLLKLKMFRAKPQGRLEIYKGTYQRPFLAEVIEP